VRGFFTRRGYHAAAAQQFMAGRAMLALRVATGAVVASTEKLANPELAQAFLQRYRSISLRGWASRCLTSSRSQIPSIYLY
jgi:hypothetical protein